MATSADSTQPTGPGSAAADATAQEALEPAVASGLIGDAVLTRVDYIAWANAVVDEMDLAGIICESSSGGPSTPRH